MKVPNNPMQAYLVGKRHGTQENMDMVAMALTDKHGWGITGEGDTIEALYAQLEYYAEEINTGRIKRRDIKAMLAEEHKLAFCDGNR